MSAMFLFLTFLPLSLAVTAKPSRPNILYILADDLGYGDVSWNNPSMITPNLERLARKGVILDQFYSQPKCSPSRAALLTGLFPYKTSMQRGAIGFFRPTGLPTILPSLPELLREEGYSSHMVGKWHLGFCRSAYLPTRRCANLSTNKCPPEQPPPSEASIASPGTTQAQSTTSATYGTRATTSGRTRTWTLGHEATTQLICSTKKRYSDLSIPVIRHKLQPGQNCGEGDRRSAIFSLLGLSGVC